MRQQPRLLYPQKMDPRETLLDLLASLSFRLGEFTLASGQTSDYYIDCRITTLHAEGGRLAGIVLLDEIRAHFPSAKAIGGLTMGADPLVSNIASASAWELADHREFLALDPDEDHGPEPTLLNGFLVRKAGKTHGTGRLIEGFLEPGADVVIVDDVCTTGGSSLQAIEAVRASGMNVVGVFALVDREQGGADHIRAAVPKAAFRAIFTAADIREAHQRLRS